MKKFLFSALACVAFAGSSFASNEVVSDFEADKIEFAPCRATVYIYNASLEMIGTKELVTDTPTHSGCVLAGGAFLAELEAAYPGNSFEITFDY